MKKVKYIIPVLIFAVLSSFMACDKIDAPYKETHNTGTDTTTYVQKVLIEDYTGHRCGNCPRAHEKLHEIIDLYGNKVIGMALHSGFFADPLPPDYPNDFRSAEAEELANTFGVSQWPIGTVNRTAYNSSVLLSYDAWTEAAAEILEQQPQAYISIQSAYNSSANKVNASVSVKLLQSIAVPVKLCVYLTEDSIIASQTDYDQNPNLIPNYVHMHVFCKSFSGTWGTDIPVSSKGVGDTLLRNLSLNWNSVWVKKNCHVVAFIYDVNTNAIIQVNEGTIN